MSQHRRDHGQKMLLLVCVRHLFVCFSFQVRVKLVEALQILILFCRKNYNKGDYLLQL